MDPTNKSKSIIKATKQADSGLVESLLASDPSLINARDTDGSTPLHLAVWKGNLELARILLDAGADVSAENENTHWGTTPLHAAAHSNRRAIAELLVQRGAKINAPDLNGNTPLKHTTFHKANATAKYLQQIGAVS